MLLDTAIPPDVEVAHLLAIPAEDGRPLRTWLDENVRADESILSTFGQPAGYVLQRKVLSIASAEYSDARWDEEDTRATMDRFHIHHLLLFRDAFAPTGPIDSRLMRQLNDPGPPPSWLQRVAQNPKALVFRRTSIDEASPR
jgi:hypothetical protein